MLAGISCNSVLSCNNRSIVWPNALSSDCLFSDVTKASLSNAG
jgi:hypothetical protein